MGGASIQIRACRSGPALAVTLIAARRALLSHLALDRERQALRGET